MKLTQTIRQAFVSAAMQDVPQIDYRAQAQALVTEAARMQLPPKVRAIYDDKNLRHFVETTSFYAVGQYVYVPMGKGERLKLNDADQKKLDALVEANKAQDERRFDLQQKLHACALACTTRKALVEMLPEFEKYLPADEAAANRALPVVANVVTDFMKAGWPKGEKKEAVKRGRAVKVAA